MQKRLMEIICCPVDKADLELKVGKENGDEVLEGTLKCSKCHFEYPIEDGIPNLLPPEMHEKKAKAGK